MDDEVQAQEGESPEVPEEASPPPPPSFQLPESDDDLGQLLSHERLQPHVQRTVQQAVATERTRWESERADRERGLAEQKRLDEMDDEELGKYVRENQALSGKMSQWQQQFARGLYDGSIQATVAAPKALGVGKDFDEAGYRKSLNEAKDFPELVDRATRFMAEHLAEKRADALAVTKAKAMYEDRIAKDRQTERGPDVSRAAPSTAGGAAFLDHWNGMTPRERLAYRSENRGWRDQLDAALAEAEASV